MALVSGSVAVTSNGVQELFTASGAHIVGIQIPGTSTSTFNNCDQNGNLTNMRYAYQGSASPLRPLFTGTYYVNFVLGPGLTSDVLYYMYWDASPAVVTGSATLVSDSTYQQLLSVSTPTDVQVFGTFNFSNLENPSYATAAPFLAAGGGVVLPGFCGDLYISAVDSSGVGSTITWACSPAAGESDA